MQGNLVKTFDAAQVVPDSISILPNMESSTAVWVGVAVVAILGCLLAYKLIKGVVGYLKSNNA